MPISYSLKKENFIIYPVGIIFSKDHYSYISIFPKWKKALLRLSLFSHALVLWKRTWQKDIGKSNKESLRHPIIDSSIGMSVVKIFYIDEALGYMVTEAIEDQSRKEDGDSLECLDIKPYFPIEDRVKEFLLPKNMARSGDWKVEQKANSIDFSKIPFFMKNIEKKAESWEISSLGFFYRKEKQCFLQIQDNYKHCLSKLEGFSHLRIFFWFHRLDNKKCRSMTQCHPPYENAPLTGIFASRSPVRPNPIGTSIAKILTIDTTRGIVEISSLDAFNQTPVLDFKPYIPLYERVQHFYVPSIVNHWPIWFRDSSDKKENAQVIIIQSGDKERLQNFQCQEEEAHFSSFLEKSIEDANPQSLNPDCIFIQGARQNNLKSISLTIVS